MHWSLCKGVFHEQDKGQIEEYGVRRLVLRWNKLLNSLLFFVLSNDDARWLLMSSIWRQFGLGVWPAMSVHSIVAMHYIYLVITVPVSGNALTNAVVVKIFQIWLRLRTDWVNEQTLSVCDLTGWPLVRRDRTQASVWVTCVLCFLCLCLSSFVTYFCFSSFVLYSLSVFFYIPYSISL
jgi:hypothetical protein